MKLGLIALLGPEVILGALLVAVLIVLVVMILRSRKPDPKLKLLLTMMQDFPKDDEDAGNEGGETEGNDPRGEHGPLGPDGFSRIALEYSSKVLCGNPPRKGRIPAQPAGEIPAWYTARQTGATGRSEKYPGGRI